jgi:hypothetical protein
MIKEASLFLSTYTAETVFEKTSFGLKDFEQTP